MNKQDLLKLREELIQQKRYLLGKICLQRLGKGEAIIYDEAMENCIKFKMKKNAKKTPKNN